MEPKPIPEGTVERMLADAAAAGHQPVTEAQAQAMYDKLRSVPAPGTPDGPCIGPCRHSPCMRMGIDAATRCALCGDPIGYDRPWRVTPQEWYRDGRPHPRSNMVHVACHVPYEQREQTNE